MVFTRSFFLSALVIPLDYPNLVFVLPIMLFALKRIIVLEKRVDHTQVRISIVKSLAIFSAFIPIFFFLWFNQMSYGNPFQLSATLPTSKYVHQKDNFANLSSYKRLKEEDQQKNAVNFLESRNMLNGFYIHFFSPDRGIVFYTPVILFGIIGLILAVKKNVRFVPLLIVVAGFNILLYCMWGDPWGGWAFGSRYLIPSYGILAIFIALFLTYWHKKILVIAIVLLLTLYSSVINALGAITTSAIPPQAEVLRLEELSGLVQKYTYERNWDYLQSNGSKAVIFQAIASNYMSALSYFQIIVFPIASVFIVLFGYLAFFTKKENDDFF